MIVMWLYVVVARGKNQERKRKGQKSWGSHVTDVPLAANNDVTATTPLQLSLCHQHQQSHWHSLASHCSRSARTFLRWTT
jgi:hypothetical protein